MLTNFYLCVRSDPGPDLCDEDFETQYGNDSLEEGWNVPVVGPPGKYSSVYLDYNSMVSKPCNLCFSGCNDRRFNSTKDSADSIPLPFTEAKNIANLSSGYGE
jgi:hypothetical protein